MWWSLVTLGLCLLLTGQSGVNARRRISSICSSEPCQNGAQCIDLTKPGGTPKFECACLPGFEGLTCQKRTDACKKRPCMNGGVCESLRGDYRCICPSKYEGPNCQKYVQKSTPCSRDVCGEYGQCQVVNDGYICECFQGYHGKHCNLPPSQPVTGIKVVEATMVGTTIEETKILRGMLIALLIFFSLVFLGLFILGIYCCWRYKKRSTHQSLR